MEGFSRGSHAAQDARAPTAKPQEPKVIDALLTEMESRLHSITMAVTLVNEARHRLLDPRPEVATTPGGRERTSGENVVRGTTEASLRALIQRAEDIAQDLHRVATDLNRAV